MFDYYDCMGLVGCMDDDACNYDPGALADDGTCEYPDCGDNLACNYNAAAFCFDNSLCEYELWYIPEVIGSGVAIFTCSIICCCH